MIVRYRNNTRADSRRSSGLIFRANAVTEVRKLTNEPQNLLKTHQTDSATRTRCCTMKNAALTGNRRFAK